MQIFVNSNEETRDLGPTSMAPKRTIDGPANARSCSLRAPFLVIPYFQGVRSFRYIRCNKKTYFGVDSGNEDNLEMRSLVNIEMGRVVITAYRDLRSSIQDW